MRRLPVGDGRFGFTLIELMVVVAVIAVVAAAVVPSFSRSLQMNRQREAGMFVVEGVFAARSRAARTGRCHRVRVIPADSVMAGGTGGAVAVDESPFSSCSTALNPPAPAPNPLWTRLSYKSVGGPSSETAGDIQGAAMGDSHAGLVGDDVAISAVQDGAGGSIAPGPMHFEPTGGLFDLTERWFEIRIDTGDGPLGITRHVRVSPGGSVAYTLRPGS